MHLCSVLMCNSRLPQISEDFGRLEPLYDEFIPKFKRQVPYILQYAALTKPAYHNDASNIFTDGKHLN